MHYLKMEYDTFVVNALRTSWFSLSLGNRQSGLEIENIQR